MIWKLKIFTLSCLLLPAIVFGSEEERSQLNRALSTPTCNAALENRSTTDEYSVSVPNDRDLAVDAWVTQDRKLVISMFTKGKNGQRHPALRGKEQVRAILKHFEGQFDGVLAIWTIFNVYLRDFDGTDAARVGDNLSAFNLLIREDHSLEDAAFQTWSGQRARENGFSKVKIESLDGEFGNYYRVHAIFSR